MAIDWKDQTRRGELHAYMIPPQRLDDSYGELLGVDWSSLSISAGYYTDTRTSGSLSIVDGNWIRNSFIRIVYEIPEWDYSCEIGTYAVVSDNAVRRNGSWITTLELQSMLWTMNKDLTPAPLTLAKGSLASTALKRELDDAGREYVYPFGADAKMTGPTALESGQSKLSRAFILCNWSRTRLDVDGHGRITCKKYVEPASKTPKLSLDLLDERGVVKDGVSRSTDWAEMPSSYILLYKYSDKDANGKSVDREIRAEVHLVSPKMHQVAANRGYEVSILESISDMSPKTYARAVEIAKQRLLERTSETVEWEIETKYMPLWEGDVITLTIPDGITDYQGKRKCLVKSIDLTGPYLDMRMTLKEVYEGVADNDE